MTSNKQNFYKTNLLTKKKKTNEFYGPLLNLNLQR